MLIIFLFQSRCLFFEEETPAFFVDSPQVHLWVEAERNDGKRQIYDVSNIEDVVEMTAWLGSDLTLSEQLEFFNYKAGQHIEIKRDFRRAHIETTWMRAGKRMALGIPLHPDHMNVADWQDISGIGPVLAQKIVTWRQENGDFVSLSHLQQVNGVGPKTVIALHRWFSSSETADN